jgi:hypothetical protein
VKRRAALSALSKVALLACSPSVRADDAIALLSVSVDLPPEHDAWLLSAAFALSLPVPLQEAVDRGVPLAFLLEFEALRPRWYWRAERSAWASQTQRIAFNALTRQYHVQHHGGTLQCLSLIQALDTVAQVRDWRVAPQERLVAGAQYEGRLRLRLDEQQLPKSFQVSALTGRDWSMQTQWKRFALMPLTPRSAL